MAIEDLKVGDIVLSRDEFDSGAAVAGRRVEAVFVRRAVVMSIGVGGRIIETTEEHPFWVVGKGWTAANAMRVGDRVLTATGEPLRIESVGEARREATVYNFRVEEWHTYFVGDPNTWGFDVWVHNNHALQAGAKRGPKTDPNAPHNARIRAEADELIAAGNRIRAGGVRPEQLIKTPGGHKEGRRPDILYETPEGVLRGRNVGKTNSEGKAITREAKALEDLNGPGNLPTDFVRYD